MKVAMQSGLKLASNSRFQELAPTAYQIKTKPIPCEFELSNGGSLVVCNPRGFAAVRELLRVDHESFFASLTGEELTGGDIQESGKSGSLFWFSKDGRFVLKTVPEEELQTLLTMLPKYAKHLKDHPDSLLTRYMGAYRLTPVRGGEMVRIVVMNNVLEGAKPHKVYDLKGTTEDRYVQENQGKCLKDINFEPMNMMMSVQMHELMHATLQADTQFLERLHIMDYSLIVSTTATPMFQSRDGGAAKPPKRFSKLMGGFEGSLRGEAADNESSEACIFHIGLIDMLTTYDFKKQVAHALKSSTIGHFYDIDTEPPDVYAERFRNYFQRKIHAQASQEQVAALPCPNVEPSATLPDLLFGAPLTGSAASAPSQPNVAFVLPPSPKASAVIPDLLDFDCMAPAQGASALVTPITTAATSSSTHNDLLCFDPIGDSLNKQPNANAARNETAMSFDLLA